MRTPTICGLLAMVLVAPASAMPAEPALEATPFFFALSVADAERSAAWYERVLGFTPARTTELAARGLEIRLLRRDGGYLELVESTSARDLADLEPAVGKRYQLRGVFKIGFLVEPLDGAIARLEALDVPLRGEVITEADGSMRSLQVEDPDGNVVQLFERLDRTKAATGGAGTTP